MSLEAQLPNDLPLELGMLYSVAHTVDLMRFKAEREADCLEAQLLEVVRDGIKHHAALTATRSELDAARSAIKQLRSTLLAVVVEAESLPGECGLCTYPNNGHDAYCPVPPTKAALAETERYA